MIKNRLSVLMLSCLLVLGLAGCSDDDDTSSGAGEPHVVDASSQNIVEVAVGAAPELTTLVSAVQAAGLVDTLSSPGPFTVFAPTNAAFAAIQSTVDSLSVDELRTILSYHVLSGIQPFSAIPATTGTPANLVGDPIRASNGTIFIIDQVLLP